MLERVLKNAFLRKAGLVFVVVAALFLIMDELVMPWYVGHGMKQDVPSVIGLSLDQAREVLQGSDLQAVEAETRPDPEEPPGTVIDQNPEAGAEVKSGRRIYLSISGGEVLVEVPALRGLSLRDARFALERAGFVVGHVSYALSDTFFVNTIMDQSDQPGSRVAKGSGIALVVSQGKDPDLQRVPDVTGMTVSEAEKVLQVEGLQVGRITYQGAPNLVPNTILDQYPRPGALSVTIRAVDLFVVKAGVSEKETRE